MSTVIKFPSVRPAICSAITDVDLRWLVLTSEENKLFVTDHELGVALGYFEPSEGVQWVLSQHVCELARHSLEIELDEPDGEGRTIVWAFDLDGAMRVCKYARTPASHYVYARIGQLAIADFAVDMGSGAGPIAQVLPFPKCKKPRKAGKVYTLRNDDHG